MEPFRLASATLREPIFLFFSCSSFYLAAAKVGGIHANHTFKADFLYDNLIIEANVIEGSRRAAEARARGRPLPDSTAGAPA